MYKVLQYESPCQLTISYGSVQLAMLYYITVSAVLSLVGPAHQLLLPLAAFKFDVF